MKRFTVTSEGQDRLGLVAIAQGYVDEQWLADHMTPEQAAEAMRDQFRRAVLAEMIEVRSEEVRSSTDSTERSALLLCRIVQNEVSDWLENHHGNFCRHEVQ